MILFFIVYSLKKLFRRIKLSSITTNETVNKNQVKYFNY